MKMTKLFMAICVTLLAASLMPQHVKAGEGEGALKLKGLQIAHEMDTDMGLKLVDFIEATIVNASGAPVPLRKNPNESDPPQFAYELGTLQAWIKPLDEHAAATDFKNAGVREDFYAAGGAVVPNPKDRIEPGEEIFYPAVFLERYNPGRYEIQVEFKDLQTNSVINTISCTLVVSELSELSGCAALEQRKENRE